MSSGKKGKQKWTKVSPQTLFTSSTATTATKSTSWADDVDEDYGSYDSYMSSKPKAEINLPTAPRAARDFSMDDNNIPTRPPFQAYLSNLPYEADEQDIIEFFADFKVVNVTLPSKDGTKHKGMGYVEFEDRETLIKALSQPTLFLKSRRIRIEVSNSSNDDRRGRMGRMGDNRRDDRYGDSDRSTGDWRSEPRDDSRPDDNDRSRSRGFDRDGPRREEREEDNKPGAWRTDDRRPMFRDEGRDDRSRPSFRDDVRDRDRNRYGNDRGSRDRDGDRDRGNYGPRRDRGGDGALNWDRQSNRPPTAGDSEPSEPRTRRKLNVLPRTIPLEPQMVAKSEAPKDTETSKSEEPSAPRAPAPAPVPSVNIFGAAKPVDTASKEREIEERLTKDLAELKMKDENDPERGDRRGVKNGTWGRRNEENRSEGDQERKKPDAWRNEGDKDKDKTYKPPQRSQGYSSRNERDRGDNKGENRGHRAGSPRRAASPRRGPARGPPRNHPEKERTVEDEVIRMPKAKDEEAPNFAASNKYSMLLDDTEAEVDE